MAEFEDIKADILSEFTSLGTAIRDDLWNDESKKFLEHISTDIAHLTRKMMVATDDGKRQRYQRAIGLLGNHVAVMTYSRVNVLEGGAKESLLRILKKAAEFVINLVLGRLNQAPIRT